MKTLIYITNDERSLKQLAEYLDYLNKDKHEDKQVEYIINMKLNRPVRSDSQNKRYWAILQIIAKETGYSTDELHEVFKRRFNGKWVLDEMIGQSTSGLDSKDFSIYCKKVEVYAEDTFGIKIPRPEDKFYNAWLQMAKNNYDSMINSI